jgi:hypothetical protein
MKLQALSQAPQFAGSNDVLVHAPSHSFCDAEQVFWQVPEMQACPEPHA